MPLTLNASTERPKQIHWDPTLASDWEAAQKAIDEHCNRGFTLRGVAGDLKRQGVAFMDPPARDPNTLLFRVLSASGDDRLLWDRRSTDEVDEARKKFDEYLTKGYTAYAVRTDGSKGSKLEEFDPEEEEILLVPRTMPG